MNRKITPILIVSLLSIGLVCILSLISPRETSAAPPQGFQDQPLILNLTEPTGITFTPDSRMFILERGGIIWVVQPGATQIDPTPLLQITNINITAGERGLVGIVLDPNFAANGYYYVFYTANSPLRDRVSRFTASGNSTVAGSELVIWQDIVTADVWHHGGTVAFGPDGKLYISVGYHTDTTAGSNNVAQRLDSYHGKILRINSDGSAPSDNPFYDGAGPNLDAIWARGLRNPFRFSFDTLTGNMYIGDVGGNAGDSIEELNRGIAGANYGWPICEGACSTSGMTNPIFSYPHNNRDASIIGGLVYRGTLFPAAYRGTYFYADYAQNWIRRLTFDGSGNVTGEQFFEPEDGAVDGPYGDITDIKMGPDGALYYVDVALDNSGTRTGPGSVRKINYFAANQPPVITTASATPSSGPGPDLTVNFAATASDPDNDPLTYTWDFGDGTSSAGANLAHTYTHRASYAARLTVSDGQSQSLSSIVYITDGTPPVPAITAPANAQTFRAGDTIAFSGTATDADGTISESNFTWTILFHHEGHIHPSAGPISGSSGTFTIPTSGHDFSGNTSYEIILTVTDSDGLQAARSVLIYPQKVNLTFDTSPSGLALSFDQSTIGSTPFVHDTLVGFEHTIDAPTQQTVNGTTYNFVSWSDGGAANHVITVPAANQTYVALYQAVGTPTATATPATPTFPTTAVLDTFNRANGAVGSNWTGTTAGYAIATNQLDVGTGDDIYWNTTSFGADQEVFTTLAAIDQAGAELDLLLKGQGITWSSGVIEVWYDPINHRVQVWTYASSQGWVQRGADIPVTFANGDRFGARASADGQVGVYQNSSLLATRNVSAWPFSGSGGRIGLLFYNASNSVADDFGGGTISSNPLSTPTNSPTPSNTPTPTNTPTSTPTNPPLPDVIFKNGFETSSLSGWSSSAIDGGNLSVGTAGALIGTYGMQALINDNNAIYVTDDSPNAEPRYRARFYFDPNSISMSNNDAHYLLYGIAGTSTVVSRVELRFASGAYQLRAALLNDSTGWTTSAWTSISDAPHFIELDWQASTAAGANNGGLTFWIDGTQRASLTGVDNDTRRIDRIQLGAVAGIDNGTRGTYYFDAFESRRTSYIGPDLSGPTPTNTPTWTPTNTPTNTPTAIPSNTPTNTPLNTPTWTPLNTPTNTPLNTPTNTPLNTPTNTPLNTPTNTPLNTPTWTPANTPTWTPTNTPTWTPTNTPTWTPTSTPTAQAGNVATLVRSGSVAGGTITLSVAGKFQLDFTSATAWQPARWLDLATSSSQDLANKGAALPVYNVLQEPIEIQYNGTWYNIADAQSLSATILEENAARVILHTEYHLRPSGSDFLVQANYTIYASGRVGVNASVQNQSGASRTLGSVEYAFLNVEDTLGWTVTALSSNHAIAFQRNSGTTPLPSLLVINSSSDTTMDTDGTGNRYWLVFSQNLASNGSFSRQWELQLGPGGQTVSSLTTRANDVRAPALTILSGGTLVGTGYDAGVAAYTLQPSTGTLSFYPTSAQQRHTPVVVITNWASPTWQVSLNGVVLASSAQPQTSQAIASYDATSQRLVIQYLGTIPTTATNAQRTFTVSTAIP